MEYTNNDLINFYKERLNKECRITNQFLSDEKNVQKGGGYVELAEVFVNIKSNKCDGSKKHCEDIAFYKWLRNQENNKFPKTGFLVDTKIDIFLEKGVDSKTQAWHLFVSYCAYKVFRDSEDYYNEEYWPDDCCPCCPNHHKSDGFLIAPVKSSRKGILKDGNVISCPELRLWMLETSGVDVGTVEKYYEFAKQYREGKRGLNIWKKDCVDMNNMIYEKWKNA